MMDPPQVLLEQSFLQAIARLDQVDHQQAAAAYLDLVLQYERHEVLLVAVSTHLDPYRRIPHHGLFAPVDRLWVGAQHRRAAQRLAADAGYPLAIALTLVMAQRHRVQRVATFEPVFRRFQLEVLPRADVASERSTPHDSCGTNAPS